MSASGRVLLDTNIVIALPVWPLRVWDLRSWLQSAEGVRRQAGRQSRVADD
jgi:hypothetical protein